MNLFFENIRLTFESRQREPLSKYLKGVLGELGMNANIDVYVPLKTLSVEVVDVDCEVGDECALEGFVCVESEAECELEEPIIDFPIVCL